MPQNPLSPQPYEVDRLTHALWKLQLRGIRRICLYGETNLDRDEELTTESEDLEHRVAVLLKKELERFYDV